MVSKRVRAPNVSEIPPDVLSCLSWDDVYVPADDWDRVPQSKLDLFFAWLDFYLLHVPNAQLD